MDPGMLFISSLLFFMLLLQFLFNRNSKSQRLPPGPRKFFIIGNLHQLGKLVHRSMAKLAETHGDLMFLQLGSVPAVVVSSPDMAREFFKMNDHAISARPSLYAARKLSYEFSDVTFAPYGQCWRVKRRIMIAEHMTAKRVHSFSEIRADEVATTMDQIAGAGSVPVDVSALAASLSNEVILRAGFGCSSSGGGGELNWFKFKEIIWEAEQLLGEFNIADFFKKLAWVNKFNGVDKRLQKNHQEMGIFFDEVIQKHLESSSMNKSDQDKDMIDRLLHLQIDQNQFLKREDIKGVLADILVGGTESSAAVIVWTMAELMRNPEAKEAAQQEVRRVAGERKRIQEDDLPKLHYLNCVLKESLRLHPPAPLLIPRETTESCKIGQIYEIPAQTRVYFNASAIGRHPKYWEKPDMFSPERFLNSNVDYKGHNFELLPFGSGRRGCPGLNFSISLVELALANLLCCFNWELPSCEDLDMEEAIGITMHKKIPLVLIASPAH